MGRTGRTWNTRGTWIVGTALAAVLALTGYTMFSGDDGGTDTPAKSETSASASAPASAGPPSMYAAPDDWTEPEQWTALPRGERTDDRDSEAGFPRTTEGAVAMLVAASTITVEGDRSNVDAQLRIYHSYLSKADHSPKVAEDLELAALQVDEDTAKQMGVRAGQPLPSGAYIRSHVVGYQVIKESDSEVSVWLLASVVQKNGEMEKESGSYTRTLTGAQWTDDGDWKVTAAATEHALQDTQGQTKPAMAAPGDAEFNQAGWTAVREAS